LFDRLGRSILPTTQAEILYPKAIAILEDLRQLEEEIFASTKNVIGELIIGASTIPGTYFLPLQAARFKEEFPSISFEIRINDSEKIAEAVAGNELLLGIVGAKIPGIKFDYEPIAEDELILVAAQNNPIADHISFETLREQPFIIRERGSGTRKSIETLLSREKHAISQLQIVATLGSSAAVKEAVKANLGVSVISRFAVQDELQTGLIREIHVDGLIMKRNFYVISSPKRTLPNHYEVFMQRLKR
jgi:DNA-binding transcriptional LysR family regulator